MLSDFTDSDCDENRTGLERKVKKRKKTGKMSDVMKKLRTSSHETGSDCNCTHLKCFEVISPDERKRIIKQFNELADFNAQSKHLSGLISLIPIERRRNVKNDEEANFRQFSYKYRVRIAVEDEMQDVAVCHKAFISLHGITNRRVQTIKKNLAEMDESKDDGRGKHTNRRHALSAETKNKVMNFIKSLKGRKSHYSLKDTSRIYLPAELNVSKLHRMYNNSNIQHKVSYTTFRDIFQGNFNIAFGFPRKDTCSLCDSLKSKIEATEMQISTCGDNEPKNELIKTLSNLEKEKKLHLLRSEKFYSLKKKYRKEARKTDQVEAIAMDFQKNLPTPNISTNDVYYRRQLNFISFNVHILSDSNSVFYTYDESVARKGADDVCSMLTHFFSNVLNATVRHLIVFCDSCAGQNKNYTVLRFLHHMVHKLERFESVKVIFPIRGHSYLECDKNISLVNTKSYVETPEEWRDVVKYSRMKPTPFKVVNCAREVQFQNWTAYLAQFYVPKCPMPTRPIRIIKFQKSDPRFMLHKSNYFGNYNKAVAVPTKIPKGRRKYVQQTLTNLYEGPLPIKAAKLKDLLHLVQFLVNPDAKDFYLGLKGGNAQAENDAAEFGDDPPIDSEDS